MTSPQPSPPADAAPVLRPTEGSRLDALLARYADLKPQVEDLKEQLETLTTAIKAEAVTAVPDTPAITLSTPHLAHLLEVTYRESWRLDSKRLKADDPTTWVRYAKRSGSWRLDPVKG